MDKIYEEYSRIVYCYLLSLNANSDIAEELMQETFYSAIKNINKFRDECCIKTWLCAIAKNKWINHLKKIKQESNVPLDESTMNNLTEEQLEDKVALKEEVAELYEKIEELSEKTQRVIELRIQAGLSFKEIGDLFNESENWAKVTFYRGRVKLREVLKNGQANHM